MSHRVATMFWSRHPLVLLTVMWCAVFLVRGLIYLALTPPWQAPDEPSSFELLLTLEQAGRLVSTADRDPAIVEQIIDSMERARYWELGAYNYGHPLHSPKTFQQVYATDVTQLNRPPLYHLLLLPTIQPTQEWPIEQRLLVARAATLVLGVIVVAAAAWIGYQLRGEIPPLPLVLPALVAFHPQFAYSMATLNSDNLVAMLGALLALVLLVIARHGVTLWRVLAFVLLLALGAWTKRTIWYFLPAGALLIGWVAVDRAWPRLRAIGGRRRVLILTAAAVAGVIAIVALMLATMTQSGRWLLRTFLQEYVFYEDVRAAVSFRYYDWFQNPGTLPMNERLARYIPFMNMSYWSSFGWHQVQPPTTVVRGLLIFVASACIAALWWAGSKWRRHRAWFKRYCLLSVAVVVWGITLTILAVPSGGLPQGRYLFPILLPISLWLSVGICGWWPRRVVLPAVVTVWTALILFDLYTLFDVFMPGFYGRG